jgi:LacI family transcriptional regulator
MATIYEVAARAGVSPATVSRVFNGVNVSAEKSRLVKKAAAELNFTPNRAARTLRRQSSEIIALIIPDIENPFFTAMARGVEDVAQAVGYSVVLCNTDEEPDKEARYLRIAVSDNMAGVILAAASDHSDLSELVSRGRPVVAVDRGPHGFDVDSVTVDSRAGGRAAADALVSQGFRRVACITGPRDVETAELRAAGWREIVLGTDIAPQWEDYRKFADYRVDGGRQAMHELLAMPSPPDAVFVANNLMAVGALQELASRELMPPAFGMAVYGELPYTTFAPSAITTVGLPARQLGATAARMLLERINGDAQPARTVVLHNGYGVSEREAS